jgi:hypothetical protein
MTRDLAIMLAAFITGFALRGAAAANADATPACFQTCAEFNAFAIRCGCGNPCMFARDGGRE